MEHKIEANPDYSILSVKVPAGEILTSLQLVNLEKPKSA